MAFGLLPCFLIVSVGAYDTIELVQTKTNLSSGAPDDVIDTAVQRVYADEQQVQLARTGSQTTSDIGPWSCVPVAEEFKNNMSSMEGNRRWWTIAATMNECKGEDPVYYKNHDTRTHDLMEFGLKYNAIIKRLEMSQKLDGEWHNESYQLFKSGVMDFGKFGGEGFGVTWFYESKGNCDYMVWYFNTPSYSCDGHELWTTCKDEDASDVLQRVNVEAQGIDCLRPKMLAPIVMVLQPWQCIPQIAETNLVKLQGLRTWRLVARTDSSAAETAVKKTEIKFLYDNVTDRLHMEEKVANVWHKESFTMFSPGVVDLGAYNPSEPTNVNFGVFWHYEEDSGGCDYLAMYEKTPMYKFEGNSLWSTCASIQANSEVLAAINAKAERIACLEARNVGPMTIES